MSCTSEACTKTHDIQSHPSNKGKIDVWRSEVDLLCIDADALFHIIDSATRFSTAEVLDEYGQSVQGI